MPLRRTLNLAVFGLIALTALPISFAPAGDPITVHLSSGRTFSGEPDSRSDNETLWLRFGSPSASLLRPIRWEQVEAIARNGEPLNRRELLELSAREAEADPRVVPGDLESGGTTEIRIRNAPSDAAPPVQSNAPLEMAQPATHLEFYAALANWDSDPYPDGLLLHLTLLDADNQPVIAPGSLQAELFAPVARRFQAVPHGRGASVLPVARWSETVEQHRFRSGEAVVRLPFSAVKPGVAQLASPYGLLHVRLAVAGQGVFEASRDGIPLQRFTPTRNLLERQDLPRTLFTEAPYRDRLP